MLLIYHRNDPPDFRGVAEHDAQSRFPGERIMYRHSDFYRPDSEPMISECVAVYVEPGFRGIVADYEALGLPVITRPGVAVSQPDDTAERAPTLQAVPKQRRRA